jgi:hypothetical protein
VKVATVEFEPFPPGARRLTPEQLASLDGQIAEAYGCGLSIRAVAEGLRCSYGFVHKRLTTLGVPLRGRGGDTQSAAVRARAADGRRLFSSTAP